MFGKDLYVNKFWGIPIGQNRWGVTLKTVRENNRYTCHYTLYDLQDSDSNLSSRKGSSIAYNLARAEELGEKAARDLAYEIEFKESQERFKVVVF